MIIQMANWKKAVNQCKRLIKSVPKDNQAQLYLLKGLLNESYGNEAEGEFHDPSS